jgi:hypothetical protein
MRKVNGLVAPQVKQVNEQRHGKHNARNQKGRIEETHGYEDMGGGFGELLK